MVYLTLPDTDERRRLADEVALTNLTERELSLIALVSPLSMAEMADGLTLERGDDGAPGKLVAGTDEIE